MIKFENLHKNHKLAYLDGLLCGVVGTIMVIAYVKEYREVKRTERYLDGIDWTTPASK